MSLFVAAVRGHHIVQHPHIYVNEHGVAYVGGTRVPVHRLFAWHRQGTKVETLVRRYPELGWAKILDALAWAYDNREIVEEELSAERERIAKENR